MAYCLESMVEWSTRWVKVKKTVVRGLDLLKRSCIVDSIKVMTMSLSFLRAAAMQARTVVTINVSVRLSSVRHHTREL